MKQIFWDNFSCPFLGSDQIFSFAPVFYVCIYQSVNQMKVRVFVIKFHRHNGKFITLLIKLLLDFSEFMFCTSLSLHLINNFYIDQLNIVLMVTIKYQLNLFAWKVKACSLWFCVCNNHLGIQFYLLFLFRMGEKSW